MILSQLISRTASPDRYLIGPDSRRIWHQARRGRQLPHQAPVAGLQRAVSLHRSR